MPFVSGGPCECACVFLLLHAWLRVHRASGIPCALSFEGARISCKPRAHSVARTWECVYSPPTRPPKPLGEGGWRGGVGGGGALPRTHSRFDSRRPPHPPPLPAPRKGASGEGRSGGSTRLERQDPPAAKLPQTLRFP